MSTDVMKLENNIEPRKKSQFVEVVRRFKRNKMAVFGAIVVIVMILVAIFAPFLARFNYEKQHLVDALQGPNATYWFGTDDFGRDLFSRIVYGARISLLVGFGAVAVGTVFGTALGLISGYYAGVIDNLLMRFVDILLSIPGLLLAISIAAMLGSGLVNTMIALSVGMIGSFARITRASVLSIKGNEFIEAAHSIGASNFRIIMKHILPNIMAPLIVQITLNMVHSILGGAALSFIGLGVQPPIPEWGALLSGGRDYIRDAWWMTVFPGVAIMIVVYGFNLMGDGLRDALDPRLKN